MSAILDEAELSLAGLKGAQFNRAHMSRARLRNSWLCGADFSDADLYAAKFNFAHLERSRLTDANLRDSIFYKAHLQGATVRAALTTGVTSFWEIGVDASTDFTGVALDVVRIDPGTKQLLEYNVRRLGWEKWRAEHRALRWPVRLFWSVSDYGLRTWRIIATFFVLAFAFGLVYWTWPQWLQGIRSGHDWRSFIHAIYFSVVTMTTLGFGDIAANPDSWQGQVLLMIQVIWGYVLLGALVTRFAVLFTAGGPAGRFAKATSSSEDQGARGGADAG